MRIGINASAQLLFPTLEGLRDHAAQTAADGFTGWWLAQTGMTDALTTFTAVAEAAPGIELGTAVIPTFPRHPSMLAAQAITTQAAVGGRLTLGIGLSHQPAVEDRWGMAFDRPVRHLREYLIILQALLEEGRVDHRGDLFTMVSPDEMARLTDEPPSVMVAALGPQMLELAGRRTDGTILWMVGPKTVGDHIAPRLNEAAASADRAAPRVVASLPVGITDDAAALRAFAAVALQVYGELPSYRAMLDREGVDGPADVSLFGTEDHVGERLDAFAAAGATDFTAVEFGLNDEDGARTRAFLRAYASGS